MERGQTLSAELARDFDVEATDLSPELQLCIAQLEELRRREGPVGERRARSAKPFLLSVPATDYPIELSILTGINEEVCELRVKAYERAGWIADEAAIISDDFDRLPTSVLVAATSGGRVVGTIRISMKTGQHAAIGLPCEMEFPGKLSDVSKSMPEAKLAEFCRVAIDPDISNKSFRATLYGSLVRAAVTVAWASEVDYALVAVHTGISRFYQHMCGFQKLAASRGYGIIKEPTNLLGAEFSALLRRSSKRSGFFHISDDEMVRVSEHLHRSNPELWQPSAQ